VFVTKQAQTKTDHIPTTKLKLRLPMILLHKT